MSSLLSLEGLLSELAEPDVFILNSAKLQYLGLRSLLDDETLVDAVYNSIRKVSLHSNNSCICNYA